ncbi:MULTISPECIES: cytochrome aa3 quinol oxidase subunit I [Geobacillus]|uniref:Cytochrome c oxidase subunit 1 n=1 Tax=Geobacillus thermocatenulatus TaxID=33938 RepID=A0A226QAP4_9BACL|nr:MULTISPECIES: cytochrome aa3 quinol oxidase subunit I [Geobacillus]ASS97875.1 cytochrome ubiquinol oxidase subunit I [Geobacillus thermocatenulatus]KLR74719.1 quinol oxidase subunit 1 [Geobacillus sp. T6]OXB88620.1 cytochrome ubiquinol oxidase subunit I [Geobacillus thermocatenulatus]RAN31192.1 quinol oxidase subunit 1 [Geobacillus sp. A8]
MKWSEFFVTGEPLIYAADVAIVLTMVGIVFVLTYFKKWKWLWNEWLTTVDHKKIGVMYIICAVLMLFRGGVDALLMRAQLTAPNMKFLDAQHYNEIFTTHGTIMILFMAMPFIIGLMNIVVPLQIGARDVAFPYLNALSFWLFFFGALLFNISFVIGGSPDAGWTAYFPLAGNEFSHGVGNNYYAVALQISGIGTLMTGINFLVTILKMRAPGMTLMRMPMFTWTILITCVLIIFAFPVLTVALALMTFDRLFDTQFFTMANGGMSMLWANLFWIWGHPEVYIVILPAFGIFSEVVSTFAGKRLFGYKAMVGSIVGIAFLSFIVWVHHFFTMGAGPAVNSAFSITTMAIAIPTGVKIFNWLFTLRKGKIRFTTAMLWSLAFIPNFVIGGVTGVMLAMAAADYQYHNSYFLIAHFHYVLIAGTVFACFAGLHYWYPKMFGHILNERLGKWTFWLFMIGFNICFFPMYFLGLMGMTRRMYTYSDGLGWTPLNVVATVGAVLMGIGFIVLCYNIYYSARYGERDMTGDPWNGRTLEWATASPPVHYNFPVTPVVEDLDAYWVMKKKYGGFHVKEEDLKPIHMPSNSGRPFWMSVAFFVAGFGLVFKWFALAIVGALFIVLGLILRSFEDDDGYYIPVDEIKRMERAARKGA